MLPIVACNSDEYGDLVDCGGTLLPGTWWLFATEDGCENYVGADGNPFTVSACGDTQIEGLEQCDDGNTDPGDGCDASCEIEEGWTCDGAPSVCEEEEAPAEPASWIEYAAEIFFGAAILLIVVIGFVL